MVARGRRAGHQNYNIPEQMLLLAMVDKYKPTGRIMWEAAAAEHNSKRAR
ncbi:hypothetical protein PI124_g6674 [Phytophthora idaei]|nr:hypothetical protein PI124_g6674 [Phytophthora idaei]